MIKKLIKTDASKTTILIRLMVGVVFYPKAFKNLSPDQSDTGRF
jgi:hypothetical protein